MHQFSAFTRRQRKKQGPLVFLLAPLFRLFTALNDAATSDTLDHSEPLCVPIFYSPKIAAEASGWATAILFITMFAVCTFGGVHCAAWVFQFPSLQEQLLWRISASSLALCPFLIMQFPAVSDVRARARSPKPARAGLGKPSRA